MEINLASSLKIDFASSFKIEQKFQAQWGQFWSEN